MLPAERTIGARINRLIATVTATSSIKPQAKLMTTTAVRRGDRGARKAHAHIHVTSAMMAGTTKQVRSGIPKFTANAGGATRIHFRLLLDLSRSALNSLPAFHSGHFAEFASERPTS